MFTIYPKSDHYQLQSQRFFNTPATQAVHILPAIGSMLKMIVNAKKMMPSQALPTQATDWSLFFADDKPKLIWLGHSSFLLRMGGKTLLIDPVFARSVSPLPIFMFRFQDPVLALQDFPEIDYIVYSHSHYDHLDKEVVQHFKATSCQFFVPLGVEQILQGWGIETQRITAFDWWQALTLDALTLTAVPARHNTGRGSFDRDKTLWAGWVFQTPQHKIYYSGDTSYHDGQHFRKIGEYFAGFDLALIENGQYNVAWSDNHLFPEQTAQAVQDVGAKCFMPVHWGAYALSTHHWSEPVRLSIPLVEQMGIQTLTPMLGQVVGIDSQTSKWWENLQ